MIHCLFAVSPKDNQQRYLEIIIKVLNANDDHSTVEVFSRHDLEVSTSAGFVLSCLIMSKHSKMYIMITDIVGEK